MMRRILMILLAVGLSTIGMTAQKSAMEVVNAMSPGWNLGNTFEASSGQGALFNNKAGLKAETSWQGTKTTQELIDFVKAQGFRSVRIPCAWVLGHMSDVTDLVNKGPMAEMLAGLELLHYRTPNIRHEIYYWQRQAKNSQAEVDYLSSYRQTVLPIEVKAEKQGGMKSLWIFLRERKLTNAIRCSLENFGAFDYQDPEISGAVRHVQICPLYAIS